MKFVNKWATLTTEELDKILDEAFKTVAERIVRDREGRANDL